jgi:hypothetical protein
MDYSKLAQVTDSINGRGKQNVTAEGRPVKDQKNPLDALEEREHITDTSKPKAIIIDSLFLKKLAKAPREERRKFISRLSDSARKRVLNELKMIKDSQGNKLGYILLDDLLANIITDPSSENLNNINDFLKSQSYIEITEALQKLIDQVKAGEVELDADAIAELTKGMDGRACRVASLVAEKTQDSAAEDTFELPEEVDITKEDTTTLVDAAKANVAAFKNHLSFHQVIDAAEDLLAEMQGKNRGYAKASEIYWKAFDEAWSEQFPNGTKFTTSLEEQEIKDSIKELQLMIDDASNVDTLFEKPAIDDDGKVVEDTEDKSVLDLLVEAVEAFAEGNSEKMEALSQHSLSVEADGSPAIEEAEEEGDIEFNAEDENSLGDSVTHFARRILGKKSVNKLADALTTLAPKLGKYNFKINDCIAPFCELPAECQAVNMPLTRDEYYQLCPPELSPIMVEMLEQCTSPQVISYEQSVPEGCLLNVNGGQMYYPYSCSAEELQNRIEQASENEKVQQIISSCAVPLRDAMRIAAACDSLPFIDTRFYKASLGDRCWTFDPECVPACMEGAPEGCHVQRCTASEANFFIFGVPFKVF